MRKRRLGYRGTVLLIMGIIEVAYGIGLIIYPLPTLPRSYWVLHEMIPYPLRAFMWVATGVVACAFAFARAPGRDRFGFVALVLMPMVRAASYVTAWVIWLMPLPHHIGYDRGWVAAVFYVGWAGLMMVEAARPEPSGYAQRARDPDGRRG